MGNTKDTGFLRNLISYDASGNIVLPANLTVTGSLLTSSGATYATQSYVTTQISNLVNAAPGALDTLNELAAALGNDANFSTTVTNSIATKLALSGGTLTGTLTITSGGTERYIQLLGYNSAYTTIRSNVGYNSVYNNTAILTNTNSNESGQGNSALPSWLINIGGNETEADTFAIKRSPAGSFTFSNRFILTSAGAATFSSSVTATGIYSNTDFRTDGGTVKVGAGSNNYYTQISTAYNYPYVDSYLDSVAGVSYEGRLNFRVSSGGGALSTKMTILNSGNVGIGTTNPAYNLSVASYLGVGAQGGGDIVLIGGGSGVGAFIQLRYATGTTNVHLAGNGNSYLNAYYGNTGIGTTNPASTLSVQGEIAKYCTTSGVDGNFQNLIKYGYSSDLQSGNSTANRWIGIDATVTAGAAVTNTLRIRAYAGGSGNAAPVNVADFRGDQSSVFYGYIKHNTRVFSGNSYVGNLSPNLNTAYSRNYLLVCDLNNVAGFSLSGHMNAASYTCWNMSSFWIMKNYSSTNGSAGITGMYKGGGCDMNIVDLNYAGGRYIAIGYTSNPEVNGMWIGYRVNHMLNADGSAIVVPDSSVSINSTYATY